MRWKSRSTLKDRLGERRTRRKFLIFPRCSDTKKWRWWEYADIVEVITEMDVGGHDEWGRYSYQWREVGFARHPKEEEA